MNVEELYRCEIQKTPNKKQKILEKILEKILGFCKGFWQKNTRWSGSTPKIRYSEYTKLLCSGGYF
jgi:hypothetical protein